MRFLDDNKMKGLGLAQGNCNIARTSCACVPNGTLYAKLLNTLPTDVANAYIDRRHAVTTTQRALAYVNGEPARHSDKHLSKLNGRLY